MKTQKKKNEESKIKIEHCSREQTMLYEESYNEFDRFFVFLVIVIVLYDPKKASILVFVPLDKNFMQMGGFIPARASIELGKVHIPSPQIKPEATAGPKASAFALSIFSQVNRIKLPTHASMAKYEPT
jgi:hypothetical protein